MVIEDPGLADARAIYARFLGRASDWDDPRLEEAFRLIRREAFLPDGPWLVLTADQFVPTPSDNPHLLYQNVLIALDPDKGINNGEPSLHAAWMGAVKPQPGEHVCQIGSGTGYYTAVLAHLVKPGGTVTAYEIEPTLAALATENLAGRNAVTLIAGDAVTADLDPCDILYVNAGVTMPPKGWLQALKPGGRMVFPWRPAADIGIAVLITREQKGFSVRPLVSSWFIPCVGASDAGDLERRPAVTEAWSARSVWLRSDRTPDETAVAVSGDLWFSSAPV
ncbi:MAG: rRNA adenine N-6-methyltransferase family protein [Pseudomonadota bacterium]